MDIHTPLLMLRNMLSDAISNVLSKKKAPTKIVSVNVDPLFKKIL